MEIPATASIPYYKSDYKKGIITLKGISIDDEVKEFFTSVINDLKVNLSDYKTDIKMEIDLVYFNTRTSRYLMDIFNIFKDLILKKGYKVSIDWYYEDDDTDMRDTANDYQSITGIPIKTIPRKPNGISMIEYDY